MKAGPSKFKVVFAALLIAGTVGCAERGVRSLFNEPTEANRRLTGAITKNEAQNILGKRFASGMPVLPSERINVSGEDYDVQYSIDSHLQQSVEQTLKKGKVPYGAFVAMDAKTGQILAMVSHGMQGENMTLRSTFPAASVFKVITAAAALENGKLQHNSLIPVRGSYHTLYRQNVLHAGGIEAAGRPRYARLISFEEALAKSVNSVFGKVGIFGVGPAGLRSVAEKFLFNKQIPFEMPVAQSQAVIPENDGFELAEAASGYNRRNTLSPVHGAMIAAAVANDGVLMEPSIVSRIKQDDIVRYAFEPKTMGKVLDKSTADQLAIMMHKTIVDGTSRRAFRGINRSLALNEVFIGGKTGTLNGWDPPGRYDWFVGFGQKENSRIAVAALCVHTNRRLGIKASAVARQALETYFQQNLVDSRSARSVSMVRQSGQ